MVGHRKLNYQSFRTYLKIPYLTPSKPHDGITSCINKRTSRKNNMKIIGIHGVAGSGKDTVAAMVKEALKSRCEVTSFAEPLKRITSMIFDLDEFYFSSENQHREKVYETWGLSPRQMLQKVGTELLRNQVSNNIWIHHLQTKYYKALHAYPHRDVFVITDVRFENEAQWILANGGEVWNIDRYELLIGERGTKTSHQSELRLPSSLVSVTIENNLTIQDLNASVIYRLEKAINKKI